MTATEKNTYLPSRRELSRTTRAVRSAVRTVDNCASSHPSRVNILHAPGEDDLALAQHVGHRLATKRPGVVVDLECVHPDSISLTDGLHSCAVVDASERESTRALLGYRWEPNQPGTGRLTMKVDDLDVAVTPGAGIEVRVSAEGLDAWVIEDVHQREFLVGPDVRRVEVSVVDGLHLLFRDETYVGDSPSSVSVYRAMGGGARRA
jgi:hypothetical protein